MACHRQYSGLNQLLPAPPGAPHQYLMTVYALGSRLELDHKAAPALVGFCLGQTARARTSLVAYGQR